MSEQPEKLREIVTVLNAYRNQHRGCEREHLDEHGTYGTYDSRCALCRQADKALGRDDK